MVKTIVYTYWTNNGSNLLLGFNTITALENQWTNSYKSISEMMPDIKIVIYTDTFGETIAKKCCPNSSIILVDYDSYTFNKSFWNFPKIISYKLLSESQTPFLHIDIDVTITKELGEHYLSKEIICEKIRTNNMLPGFVRQIGWNIPNITNLICSGLLGGNRLDVFQELYNMATSSEAVNNDTHFKVHEFHRHTLEEISTSHICRTKGITPLSLEGNYIHYQGRQKLLLK